MDLCLEKASLVIIKSTFNFENKAFNELDAFEINDIFTRMGKMREDTKAKLIIQTHNFANISKVNFFFLYINLSKISTLTLFHII